MKAERVDTKGIEAQTMEPKAQVFEAEKARARQIWRENVLKAELVEVEERDWRAEIEGEEHVLFLG